MARAAQPAIQVSIVLEIVAHAPGLMAAQFTQVVLVFACKLLLVALPKEATSAAAWPAPLTVPTGVVCRMAVEALVRLVYPVTGLLGALAALPVEAAPRLEPALLVGLRVVVVTLRFAPHLHLVVVSGELGAHAVFYVEEALRQEQITVVTLR